MSEKGDLLPSATECMKKVALVKAEKASALLAKQAVVAAKKRELMERLQKPSGVSNKERLQHFAAIIQRAVDDASTEVLIGRFPNSLITDHGRAINQMEPGWENTLTGVPNEIYQFWHRYLKPRGYRLRVHIVDWPDGVPGDIGITLA
jgi:hypothetical protein